jgi:hypothetical protein
VHTFQGDHTLGWRRTPRAGKRVELGCIVAKQSGQAAAALLSRPSDGGSQTPVLEGDSPTPAISLVPARERPSNDGVSGSTSAARKQIELLC